MRISPPGSILIAGQPIAVNTQSGNIFPIVSAAVAENGGSAAPESALAAVGSKEMWGATVAGAAAAGAKAVAELLNPAASGKVLYVYALDLWVATAMSVSLALDGTSLAPVAAGVALYAGGAAGVAKVGGGSQAAPTGAVFYASASLAANTPLALAQPWICAIPAGHNLQLQGATADQAFTVNLRWIELQV